MSFWSTDLKVENAQSPRRILKEMAAELQQLTGLRVNIAEDRLNDRIVLGFVAQNSQTQDSVRLFEVSHQAQQPYPARIDPPSVELPSFLKRERYEPGLLEIPVVETLTKGRTVVNRWICSTPKELRKMLADLAESSEVKSRIVNLVAPSIDEDLLKG